MAKLRLGIIGWRSRLCVLAPPPAAEPDYPRGSTAIPYNMNTAAGRTLGIVVDRCTGTFAGDAQSVCQLHNAPVRGAARLRGGCVRGSPSGWLYGGVKHQEEGIHISQQPLCCIST
jgi:hypothetical protein